MFCLLKLSREVAFCIFFLVQIVLESLPISSSAHLKLLEYFSCLMFSNNLFNYLSDLTYISTFFIIFLFFFREWLHLLKLSFSTVKEFIKIFKYFVIVEGLTLFFYIFFNNFNFEIPIYSGFLITAAVLWASCFFKTGRDEIDFSVKDGVILGLAQGISLIPGISRFGFTYFICRALGYGNRLSMIVSLMILLPLSFGLGLRGIYRAYASGAWPMVLNYKFLIAGILATILSYFLLYLVEKILIKNRAWFFSIYLLAVAVLSFYFAR